MQTLAFDVYGTLVDPLGMAAPLRSVAGDRAQALSELWRSKQLEFAFRRGLMRDYADFDVCTRDALLFTLERFGIRLAEAELEQLLEQYRRLPAFADAASGLGRLKATGIRCLAFSNGTRSSLDAVLGQAGLLSLFDGVVSVDDIKTFKPNPAVYNHLVNYAAARHGDCWLVSGNAWDLIGARHAGLNTAWVNRSQAPFDPWGGPPDLEVADLDALADCMEAIT